MTNALLMALVLGTILLALGVILGVVIQKNWAWPRYAVDQTRWGSTL
jgi:hypothetical protein